MEIYYTAPVLSLGGGGGIFYFKSSDNSPVHIFSCVYRVLRFSVIDPHYRSLSEMYNVIDTLTNQDLQKIVADFKQNIKADILVVGNVTPKVSLIKFET